MNSTLKDICKKINKAKNIAILAHENPDGDAIGSALAVYHALRTKNKNVKVYLHEISRLYNFLPGIDKINYQPTTEKFDLIICVDCATTQMLGRFKQMIDNTKTSIVIDHHGTNTMYGDINYINPNSPACCQVLIPILKALGIKDFKGPIGTSLITGIITDTGGFQYSNVKPETFEFAGELLLQGVKIHDIYKRTLETKTRSSFELNKIAINRLEFLEDGKITFTYINKQDQEKVNHETGDSEGIANIGRGIEGVEVSIFIKEIENSNYRVSIRSNDYVNVSDICLLFGGGGHFHAAGCKMQGTPEQIRDTLVKEIKRVLV